MASIKNRVHGAGCPYCGYRKLLTGFNDLETTRPDIAKEWDYEKNAPLTPDKVFTFANKKVWWKCANGHSWNTLISTRSNGSQCPYCSELELLPGYNDLNRFGEAQNLGNLNKAIKRIIRDCNDEQFLKSDQPKVLLPNFSCHSLRHTFTTRMCEAGINIKVIQDTLGHKDISTTMNISVHDARESESTADDHFVGIGFAF